MLIYIIPGNVSQPDSIPNTAIKKWQQSKMRWNGLPIFVAVNHKPVPIAGPTMLFRTVDLMLHLEILIKKKVSFRGIQTGKKDPVFVSWSGRKMESSMVTTQLNQFWKKATDKNLHFKVLIDNDCCSRKETSTKMFIATDMNHNVRTTKRD